MALKNSRNAESPGGTRGLSGSGSSGGTRSTRGTGRGEAYEDVTPGGAQQRHKKQKINKIGVIAVAAGILIIVFAFIAEGVNNRREAEKPEPIFGSRSKLQAELNELEWIEKKPLTVNEYSRPGKPLPEADINGIVIHYVGNPGTSAEQNRTYFENLAVTKTASVSSHFLIDIDGTILQCIPVDEIAYATGIRNSDTLSIEVCHPDETGEFTRAAYNALVRLTALLCSKFGLTESYVLRHYDATGKECPRYFVENEEAWRTLLNDIRVSLAVGTDN